jgi:hypothetical protein
MPKNKIEKKYEVYQDDLLLHSMSNFMYQISQILNVLKPKSICEVGIEGGKFTEYLLTYTKDHNISYKGIEPKIDEDVKKNILNNNQKIYEMLSLKVLPDIKADIFFLDGDHNYYTLYNELKLIYQNNPSAVVFLHDISWPWRYRDLYYNPGVIPNKYIHPYEYTEGIRLGIKGTVKYGFRGLRQYAYAKTEGGEKNGLLPAIQDFLLENQDESYEYIELFAVFGLGILFNSDKLSKDVCRYLTFVKECFEFINPLVINMESNRLELLDIYWEIIEERKILKDDIKNKNIIINQLKQELILMKNNLEQKNQELISKDIEIKQKKDELHKVKSQLLEILNSRAWKIIEKYRKIKSKALGNLK